MSGNSLAYDLHQTLSWKVRNFSEDVYHFNPHDKLTSLMSVLLGESGTGQLAAIQVAARLLQQFPYFSDLDTTMGTLLHSPRLVSELYSSTIDPFIDQLSLSQWADIINKDTNYRERLIATAAALLKGATTIGMQAMAEATGGVKFQVIENWSTVSGVTTASGWSRGLDGNEIIFLPIVPSGLTFDNNTRDAVIQSLGNLQPVGTVLTVTTGTVNNFNSVPIVSGSTVSSSDYFYFDRQVTANNINIPAYVSSTSDPSVTNRYWLRNGITASAPYFAFGQTQEQIIDVTANISNVVVTRGATVETSQTTAPLGVPTLPLSSTALGV